MSDVKQKKQIGQHHRTYQTKRGCETKKKFTGSYAEVNPLAQKQIHISFGCLCNPTNYVCMHACRPQVESWLDRKTTCVEASTCMLAT